MEKEWTADRLGGGYDVFPQWDAYKSWLGFLSRRSGQRFPQRRRPASV